MSCDSSSDKENRAPYLMVRGYMYAMGWENITSNFLKAEQEVTDFVRTVHCSNCKEKGGFFTANFCGLTKFECIDKANNA